MARRYLAFDIETAADVPGPDFDWRSHRPLGITCAAALACDASEATVWHGEEPDGTPAARMSSDISPIPCPQHCLPRWSKDADPLEVVPALRQRN